MRRGQPGPKGRRGCERSRETGEREIRSWTADDRQAVSGDRGSHGRGEDRCAGLSRPARGSAGGKDGERQEPERADRRQQRPDHKEQGCARPGPEEREPPAGEHAVEDREAERDVAERQDRNCQREGESEPRAGNRQECRHHREADRPVRGEERERPGGPTGEQCRRHCGCCDGDRGLRGKRQAPGERASDAHPTAARVSQGVA